MYLSLLQGKCPCVACSHCPFYNRDREFLHDCINPQGFEALVTLAFVVLFPILNVDSSV